MLSDVCLEGQFTDQIAEVVQESAETLTQVITQIQNGD